MNNETNDGKANEQQYLDAVSHILARGKRREDRTGTGTLAVFGVHLRFDLSNRALPLLTTRRVFWRGVAEELLWFLSGSTDARVLAGRGVHIWDGNGSRRALDARGLEHRREGDLGPVYGFQWRHWNAPYVDADMDYAGQGVDQVAEVVRLIKTDPSSRRILLTAWNPSVLADVALPPCHVLAQFFVSDGTLSCQVYQRSGDIGLGVPFNMASYALLTHLLAHVCDLEARELVLCIGDAHVYLNHVAALTEQLTRAPRPGPRLTMNPECKKKSMDAWRWEDLGLEGYDPYPNITMAMAV